MLFNSLQFVVFFIVITSLYFILSHKYRWLLLLFASCFFYMFFKPIYILILGFTIVIDYFAGILIENENMPDKKTKYLIVSIIANVGVLAVFKYYNFINSNIDGLGILLGFKNPIPYLQILLPIGLSFHTFQAMSYTIEVYWGRQKAERHFGIYALYVMFYPQLVAGPIERPQNMIHQFHEEKFFNYSNAVTGLRLMMWGMFKKVVIADRLVLFTDPVFNAPHNYSASTIFIASIFFSFQIFCDFSGYSDIALGTARVMGFKLMTNFNMPYHSRSISEFWKRWHISLSTWFRDYLYFSLGGNRVSVKRTYFNLFFVFLVSGFWHGANWTFIVWGALHGFYLIFGLLTSKYRNKVIEILNIHKIKWLNNTLNVVVTFTLVTYAWIFFRANNIHDTLLISRKLLSIPSEFLQVIRSRKLFFLNLPNLIILRECFMCILFLEIAHLVSIKFDFKNNFNKIHWVLRWSMYYGGVLAIYYLGVFEKHQFIYFQF